MKLASCIIAAGTAAAAGGGAAAAGEADLTTARGAEYAPLLPLLCFQ